jgi:diaminopimelate epimerase
MATLPFAKVEGLGNDFIVIDLRPGRPGATRVRSTTEASSTSAGAPTLPELARAVCDRHFGIGADGVLAILPGDKGDARMQVINADGSEAEMCGNGIRCVAKVLYERDPALARPLLRIDTGAGLLDCALDVTAGRVSTVRVEMGRPRLTREEIPMTGEGRERVVRSSLSVGGRTFSITGVSMGNPHAVVFVDDPTADLRALAETHGPQIEVDPSFPKRTNVEFARVRASTGAASRSEIDLVVWERGCGITLACGTGACATVVAACLESRLVPGIEVPVHLPGGTLHITVKSEPGGAAPAYSGVLMRGPASIVFEAEIDLARLPTPRNRS